MNLGGNGPLDQANNGTSRHDANHHNLYKINQKIDSYSHQIQEKERQVQELNKMASKTNPTFGGHAKSQRESGAFWGTQVP